MTNAFEIRVEGVLARSTLHRLGCESWVAGPQTVLRIEATPSALLDVVNDCSRRGATIDSIFRIDPCSAEGGRASGRARQQRPSS